MASKIDLQQNVDYRVTMSMGSYGNYRIRIRWNDYSSLWVIDMTNEQDEPILYGQPLILREDLFRQWKNLGVPRGTLFLLDNASSSTNKILSYDNVTDYSIVFVESE